MKQWINYHHLYYFKTIAEEKSVSLAAKRLRLGQPTLSAQLKQFEMSLGVQLFDRAHRQLELTEQGKRALEYAQNIFKMGDEMIEVLHDRIDPQSTHIHIAALDSIPKSIILSLVKKVYSFGKCKVTLSEGGQDTILPRLFSHQVDLFITNFIPNTTEYKNIVYKKILKQSVSLYGSKKFLKLKKDFPQSLAGQPIVVPTFESRMRFDLEHWLGQNKIYMEMVAESQDISLKKLLAIEGVGLVPGTAASMRNQLIRKDLFEIAPLVGLQEEIFIATCPRKNQNPLVQPLMRDFSLA